MADSSCSNTMESMGYEHVNCRKCGRKARVLLSNSVKNLGRLYYGCIAHGWVKWVIPDMPENEDDFQPLRRRCATERRETEASIEVDFVKNVGFICRGIFWALVMTILVLIAANLFALLIWLVKG